MTDKPVPYPTDPAQLRARIAADIAHIWWRERIPQRLAYSVIDQDTGDAYNVAADGTVTGPFMEPSQFTEVLFAIGWSRRTLAEKLGLESDRVVRLWTAGKVPVPPPVARWLREIAQTVEAMPPSRGWGGERHEETQMAQ